MAPAYAASDPVNRSDKNGHCNVYIGGAGDEASPRSPIGRRRDVESQGTTWINFYVARSERNMASFPDQVAVNGGAWRYRQNAGRNFSRPYDMYSETPFGTVPSGHMDIFNIDFSVFFDALYRRNLDR